MMFARLMSLVAVLVLPFLLVGLINRVKAWWSGRRGAPLLQPAWDVLRLLRKRPVYARATTPLFRISAWLVLLAAAAPVLVVPVLGAPLFSFSFDFLVLAYTFGLGRIALMLGALDTGSSFEGMGAAREATFATLTEPAWFLMLGALCLFTHSNTLSEALALKVGGGGTSIAWVGCLIGLFVLLQVEASRMPVDDPTTHLELTMIHEVMVLDHSGPELAAVQWASALKILLGCSFITALLNPFAKEPTVRSAIFSVLCSCGVAVVVGTLESLIARLRMKVVPHYIAAALVAGAIALLASTWRAVGSP